MSQGLGGSRTVTPPCASAPGQPPPQTGRLPCWGAAEAGCCGRGRAMGSLCCRMPELCRERNADGGPRVTDALQKQQPQRAALALPPPRETPSALPQETPPAWEPRWARSPGVTEPSWKVYPRPKYCRTSMGTLEILRGCFPAGCLHSTLPWSLLRLGVTKPSASAVPCRYPVLCQAFPGRLRWKEP